MSHDIFYEFLEREYSRQLESVQHLMQMCEAASCRKNTDGSSIDEAKKRAKKSDVCVFDMPRHSKINPKLAKYGITKPGQHVEMPKKGKAKRGESFDVSSRSILADFFEEYGLV